MNSVVGKAPGTFHHGKVGCGFNFQHNLVKTRIFILVFLFHSYLYILLSRVRSWSKTLIKKALRKEGSCSFIFRSLFQLAGHFGAHISDEVHFRKDDLNTRNNSASEIVFTNIGYLTTHPVKPCSCAKIRFEMHAVTSVEVTNGSLQTNREQSASILE